MPQRCVNTLGPAPRVEIPMHTPEYSDLARYKSMGEAIIEAAGGLMASNQPVVYFVQAGDDGPIKIGYCHKFTGVRPRLDNIQTGCPWPLVIRRVIPVTSVYAERQLHEEFAPYRLAGEWFEPAPPVANAAGVTPSTSALRELLALAWQRGRESGIGEAVQEGVRSIADELRASLIAWEQTHAPEADGDWETRRREVIDGLLERRAA
jgi:hypothetical protein